MLYDTEHEDFIREGAAAVAAVLPAAVALTQRCAALLRAYLAAHQLDDWRIFHCGEHDHWDIDRHLKVIGEGATWEALGPLVEGGESIAKLTLGASAASARVSEGGAIYLREHQVVLARWYWLDPESSRAVQTLWLHAAPSADQVYDLRHKLNGRRRERAAGTWQIVRGYAAYDRPSISRAAPDDLLLPDNVSAQIDVQLVGFFSTDVRWMYDSLKVPYRRGVLLHGPPGNGKTSLIRHVGVRLPHVPAMILRPADSFDSDDLEEVVRRWTSQAPAILVIEDLNWLLQKVNVSTFLNLLDGIESTITGGLMLIATSNHPQQLDPAVNNRPGRFDVVIDIPAPTKTLRTHFFASKLPGVETAVIEQLVTTTDGLSFAHLQEVLRLSGLSAIHNGRAQREDRDLLDAAATVGRAHHDAERGFPSQQEVPFGFLPVLQRQR